MTFNRATLSRATLIAAFATVLAAMALTATLPGRPALAQQVGKPGLVDVNAAPEGDLAKLPGLTPAVAKGIVEHRPFKTVVDLNKYLVEQKLTADQTKALYAKAFVP